jgi:hypothetical protein
MKGADMTTKRIVNLGVAIGVGLAISAACARAESAKPKATPKPKPGSTMSKPTAEPPVSKDDLPPTPAEMRAAAESKQDMTLKGGDEGTAFRTLTIEGEDRIRLDFERPRLEPTLDFASAPGLDLARAPDVLSRSAPDPAVPLIASSAFEPSPWLARPWLTTFASGPVARFRPEVDDVERWKLTLTDSRGQVVAVREGKGKPPEEIAWDGLSDQGRPLVPGLTYSHLFEAWDRAGNRRRFVGEGFRVSACRLETAKGSALAFGGAGLDGSGTGGAPPMLLEAASWVAQIDPQRPIQVTATARSKERADQLANTVIAALSRWAPGPASRYQAVHNVMPDAPESGAVRVELKP